MAGISSLFPDLPKQMSVMDRVKIIIQWHKNNYFKNWSTQELDDADVCNISTIPITILTTILYTSKIYFVLNHNTGTILVYNTGTNLHTNIVHNTSTPVLRSPSTGDPNVSPLHVENEEIICSDYVLVYDKICYIGKVLIESDLSDKTIHIDFMVQRCNVVKTMAK